MRQAVACPCCFESSPTYAGDRHGALYWSCPWCGTLFTAELPTDICCTQNEDPGGRNSAENMKGRADRIEMRAPGVSTGTVVDFGCGEGQLLQFFKTRWPGATVHGIDVDTPLQLHQLKYNTVDAISAVEVLEHLYAPRMFFWDASRALRPGGILYAETCPIDAIGPEHPYVDPRIGHVTVFSERALCLLGDMCGIPLDEKINPTTFIFRKR